jgi:hypothetical protein
MSAKALSAADAANQIESDDNDVRRAVSEWGDCDVAALVEDGGNIGPATRLGDVEEINDFDEAPFVLVKVNLR